MGDLEEIEWISMLEGMGILRTQKSGIRYYQLPNKDLRIVDVDVYGDESQIMKDSSFYN